jgi:ABC-type Fe3+-siderophore transport system permease subunit
MILVIFAVFIGGMFFNDNLIDTLELSQKTGADPEKIKWLVMGIMAIAGIVFTTVMGGIYFLLYGLLTRRLYYNYKDLKRIDN